VEAQPPDEMHICQNCNKNAATIQVTDVLDVLDQDPDADGYEERHLCDTCAQQLNLPHSPVPTKTMADIWKLLQISAQKAQHGGSKSLTCPDCNMTLAELRRRGKLGCAKDYEVFKDYLAELFERMHGATQHVGRVPGIGEGELERVQRISDLQQELGRAISDEAYERAAKIRDELKDLGVDQQAG